MSSFPSAGIRLIRYGDMKVTSPTPESFPTDYAACRAYPPIWITRCQKRPVVTHYFTRRGCTDPGYRRPSRTLGPNYPDPQPGGSRFSRLAERAAARPRRAVEGRHQNQPFSHGYNRNRATAIPGPREAVSLTGHRFPAGFSQERTALHRADRQG